MEVPKNISVCPIIDCVVELRFESSIHPNAVFGLLFNALKEEFPDVEKLPILQLPEQLRDIDPNFKHKAHYKLISEDGFTIQIGPDVIVFGSPIPYQGWEFFSNKLSLALNQVFETKIFKTISRLGLRYINFFETDIFENINLSIDINKSQHTPINTQLKTEIIQDKFSNTLNIANNAQQFIDPSNVISGSIIDIDTFKMYDNLSNYQDIFSEIEKAHHIEKSIFFTLLKSEFLETLQPEY